MAVNETIVTGRKFRKCIDAATKAWQRISFWTKSSDVEFEDGKNAETKLGAIDGITDSLEDTSSRLAASAKAISTLNNNLGGCQLTQEGEDFYIVGADSVRKKLGSENVAHIISFQHSSPAGARYPSYKITWDVKKAKKVTFIYNVSEGNVSALYYIGNSSYFTANKGANTIDISQVNTFSLALSHDTVLTSAVGVSDITFE